VDDTSRTAFSERHRFSEWPNAAVPLVAAGVYVIWDGGQLIYAGMSGRELDGAIRASKSKYGLVTRLASHASGRLSGNQFCVYVANRLVIPRLTPNEMQRFATGELTLDQFTKRYIREKFEYQFAQMSSSSAAFGLERRCRAGGVFGVRPLLNPLMTKSEGGGARA
jgi:hypothetical protein